MRIDTSVAHSCRDEYRHACRHACRHASRHVPEQPAPFSDPSRREDFAECVAAGTMPPTGHLFFVFGTNGTMPPTGDRPAAGVWDFFIFCFWDRRRRRPSFLQIRHQESSRHPAAMSHPMGRTIGTPPPPWRPGCHGPAAMALWPSRMARRASGITVGKLRVEATKMRPRPPRMHQAMPASDDARW